MVAKFVQITRSGQVQIRSETSKFCNGGRSLPITTEISSPGDGAAAQ
jgi:hypothetical protein